MYTRAQKTWFHVQTRHYFLPLHCLHADWDRDQPSLPFKSHKTINLTSTDHPILLGSSEKSTVNSSLDFTSRVSTDPQAPKEPPTRTVIVSEDTITSEESRCLSGLCFSNKHTLAFVSPQDVQSSGVNGGFCEEPLNMRNKGKEQSAQSERL